MKLPKPPIEFERDKGNTDKNFLKHNVTTKEAEEPFADKSVEVFEDVKHSGSEKRFVACGRTKLNRKLTIIFTLKGQKIRVISARDQSKKERKMYGKEV